MVKDYNSFSKSSKCAELARRVECMRPKICSKLPLQKRNLLSSKLAKETLSKEMLSKEMFSKKTL